MEEIPPDSPFIYADPEKKKKFVLIGADFSVTGKEFDRIRKWFELQFFVTGEIPRADSIVTTSSESAAAPAPGQHIQRDPVLVKVPPQEPEIPTSPVPDSE